MERLRGQLLEGDRTLFDEVEGSIAIEEGPGLQEWRGQFWLPESSPVRPGGKYGLIRDDGGAGELIVDRFEPVAAGAPSRCPGATAVSSDERGGRGQTAPAPPGPIVVRQPQYRADLTCPALIPGVSTMAEPTRSPLTAADVMTTHPRTCSAFSSVLEASVLFQDADCGAVPVVDGGRPIGILTDRDVALAVANNADLSNRPVADFMSKHVISVAPDASLEEVGGALRSGKAYIASW